MSKFYTIGEVAEFLKVHPQTIRSYESAGFIEPARSRGGIRQFSDEDINRLKLVLLLTKKLGVNLAGVEIIERMLNQIENMQDQMEYLVQKVKKEIDLNYEYQRPKAIEVRIKHSIIKIDIDSIDPEC